MDPLPVLKEDEKEKEKYRNLSEDEDGHEIDEEDEVGNLWTPGGRVETAWLDREAAILVSSGMDVPKAGAELTMNFLGNVVPRADSTEPEKPDYDLEEFA
jgi:hypothetical protein